MKGPLMGRTYSTEMVIATELGTPWGNPGSAGLSVASLVESPFGPSAAASSEEVVGPQPQCLPRWPTVRRVRCRGARTSLSESDRPLFAWTATRGQHLMAEEDCS